MASFLRRTFLLGLLTCGCAPQAPIASSASGCRGISARRPWGAEVPEDIELDPNFLIGSTGRHDLDETLGKALLLIRAFFGVNPGVGMYDDYGQPNALTYAESFVKGARGTVALGQDLLKRQLLAHSDDGISVLGILAHEFAHVLQNDHNLGVRLRLPDNSVKLIELHADFLAGLYLAHLADGPNVRLYETGQTFSGLGDTEFGNPDHHGTAKERVAAVEFGFRIGRLHPDLRPPNAIDESIRYVRDTFGSRS
jgi:hypothetical protein